MNEAFETNVGPTAEMAVFGAFNSEYLMPVDKKNAFAFATLLARRRIVMEWKSPNPPKVSLWLSDLMLFLKLEKIKYFTRGTIKTFHKVWDPLIFYFEELNSLPSDNV